jgi:hypothetical protein
VFTAAQDVTPIATSTSTTQWRTMVFLLFRQPADAWHSAFTRPVRRPFPTASAVPPGGRAVPFPFVRQRDSYWVL